MSNLTRAWALALAIFAMLGVSVASTSAAHAHANAPAPGCDICFTAHVTVFQTPAQLPAYTPQVWGFNARVLPFFGYQRVSATTIKSRGPPCRF